MDVKPGVLRNLRVKRVSLVDEGANFDEQTKDGAHILLYKSKVVKDGPGLSSVHVDSPDWDVDDQDEYEKADLTAEGRRGLADSDFAAVWTDAQGKKHRKLPIHDAGHLAAARGRIDEAQMPADVKAAARRKIDAKSHKEKTVAKTLKEVIKSVLGMIDEPDVAKRKEITLELSKAVDQIEDPVEIEKAAAHDPKDDMCKCASCMAKRDVAKSAVEKRMEEVEKQNVALEKRNKELADSIEVEKGLRLDRDMADTLRAFKNVPLDLTKDVTKFRKMKETDPALFERTMEIFKAAEGQLAANMLIFKQIGSDLPGAPGGAYDQMVAKANAKVEKDAKGLTFAQAMDAVQLENPQLVAQYRAEQN